MDLDIEQMEFFTSKQIECLEMMKKLIAYDKETAEKNNLPSCNTRLIDAFIDTQAKALAVFKELLVKHKPALEAIKDKVQKEAAEKRKVDEKEKKIKEDAKKAMSEEGSLFSCSEPATVEEVSEPPLLGDYDIEECDCDNDEA